jgi:hypothetical protein
MELCVNYRLVMHALTIKNIYRAAAGSDDSMHKETHLQTFDELDAAPGNYLYRSECRFCERCSFMLSFEMQLTENSR